MAATNAGLKQECNAIAVGGRVLLGFPFPQSIVTPRASVFGGFQSIRHTVNSSHLCLATWSTHHRGRKSRRRGTSPPDFRDQN